MVRLLMLLLLGACAGGSDLEVPSGPDETPTSPGTTGVTETMPTTTPPPMTLASGTHIIEHDGRDRKFNLFLPSGLTPGAPLVVVLHGYGGSADYIESYAGMNAVAEREGFAVAYPQGTRDQWNYNYWEVGYAFHPQNVDDVGFINAVADLVVSDQGLDASAVFATGMSNGGDMSYRLACEAADRYAAVAPVAGCLMVVIQDTCAPDPDVPLMEIHGTADNITPWEGDVDGSDGYGPYLGTVASVEHFADAYGLETYAAEDLPNLSNSDGSEVVLHRWTGSSSAAEVRLYEVVGGRHDWPGAGGNQDIVAAEEIWSFFSAYVPSE